MKRILLTLLVLIISLFVVSCSTPEDISGDTTNRENDEVKIEDTTATDTNESVEDTEEKEWGVPEAIVVVSADNRMQNVCVNFPEYAGIPEGTGKIAFQGDYSCVLLDGEGIVTDIVVPEDKIENLFPAYFQQTIDFLSSHHTGLRDNYEFELKDKELVNIADYEMCKFTGTCSYRILSTKQDRKIDFVAYATKAKGNGAYVYWMVLDESEDGSLGEVIGEHARKMAESIFEN